MYSGYRDNEHGQGILRERTQPIKLVVDEAGEWWFCDPNVDPERDLAEQGAIAYSDMPSL